MEITDRIEKVVTLRAPVSRVWRALVDAREFGEWFGVALDGDFIAGEAIHGTFNMKIDETALMARQEQMGLKPSRLRWPEANAVFGTVERIEPEHYFSFRWVPFGIDAEASRDEPTTLVEFRLESIPEGTRLTVTESGFDRVPAHRRARAFRMNEGGWTGQAEKLRAYVESAGK